MTPDEIRSWLDWLDQFPDTAAVLDARNTLTAALRLHERAADIADEVAGMDDPAAVERFLRQRVAECFGERRDGD